MDIEELVDEFITFFWAGQETTSNSLAFTIMELGLNPHCFEKFVEKTNKRVI
jgi:cholesterol 24(S)-hydroxylase